MGRSHQTPDSIWVLHHASADMFNLMADMNNKTTKSKQLANPCVVLTCKTTFLYSCSSWNVCCSGDEENLFKNMIRKIKIIYYYILHYIHEVIVFDIDSPMLLSSWKLTLFCNLVGKLSDRLSLNNDILYHYCIRQLLLEVASILIYK